MSALDDSPNLLVYRSIPQRDRFVCGGCDECAVACQGDAYGIVGAVNAPFRQRGLGGHIDTVNIAVVCQSEELLAITDPGEGVVQRRVDFDWEVDEEGAILTIVDPDGVMIVHSSGVEASIG